MKNKQEAYENLFELSRNEDYTTRNVLEYPYRQKYYKRTGIDLSRQTNTTISQQINFVEKSEKDNGTTMFFTAEKQQETILNFSLDTLNVKE